MELVLPIEQDRVTIAFLPVGESKIELVQPTDDTTGVARFLASKGEGFHHVCFEVDDITAALMRLELDGHRGHRPGGPQGGARARSPSSTRGRATACSSS